jgi:hypothetical protein
MLKKIFLFSTFAFVFFSISSAETPDGYYAPASVGGGTLNAQDSNWPVYDETISFSSSGTFTANITNGIDDPSGSGSYTYSKTGTSTASLSYTIDGPGYSFKYDLQFTGENAGIYTKFADYGSEEDITTGPFSLIGIAVPEQYPWEEYDDFSSTSVDTSKWSMGHWDGGNLPTISSGKIVFSGNTVSGFKDVLPTAGMLAFNSGIGPLLEEAFSSTNGTQSHSYLELLNDDQILGIEVEVQLPAETSISTGIGLYASDWAKTFSEEQSDKSFFGLDLRSDHIDIEYVDLNTGLLVSTDLTTVPGNAHVFAFILEEQNVLLYVDGTKVAEFSSANFSRDSILVRAMNGAGEPFSAYAKNVRVLRQQETTEPEPVTVTSDPNGKAVVVQVGDEYKWNSTLDGVTLWLVGNDSDSIIHATIKYEGGNYLGNFEFLDEVTNPISTLSYAINENGYLAHTESLGQQYFQILSVEEGRIETIGFMNDLSLANHSSEPTEFFFITRVAAEEYYYSKANPKDWMWFDHYPWVYSNEQQDWLYFYPSGGSLMYFSNKGQAWRQFN